MTGGVIWWLFKVVSDTRLLLFLCTWTLTLTVPGILHAIKAARYKKTSVRWRVLYHGYHGPNIIDVRMVDFCTVLFHGLLFNPNILDQYRGKRMSDTRRTSLHNWSFESYRRSSNDTSPWSASIENYIQKR